MTMRVHEIIQKRKSELQMKADTESADKLRTRYLNYLESIAAYIPGDPLTDEELMSLVKVDSGIVRRGN